MLQFSIFLNDICINIHAQTVFAKAINDILFSSLLEQSKNLCPMADFTLTVRDNNFVLSDMGGESFIFPTMGEVLYTLEWKIVDKLVGRHNRFFQFHGAALSFGNCGYIFIGNPGTGKTSLSILLMRKGFGFFSDEISLIDPENFVLAPFPRNLIIKPHLQRDLFIPQDSIALEIDADNDEKEFAYFLSPDFFGKTDAKSQVKLKKIFFLHLTDRENFYLESVGNHEAFNQLLPQLFNADKIKNTPGIIVQMLQKIPCFNLYTSKPLLYDKQKIDNLKNQIISE